VADHEQIERRALRELPGARPVVDGDADRPDLAALAQVNHLALDGARPRRPHAQPAEQVRIEVVGPELAQELLGASAHAPSEPPYLREANDSHAIAPALERVAQRAPEPFAPRGQEEQVDAPIHCGADAVLVDAVVRGEPQTEEVL